MKQTLMIVLGIMLVFSYAEQALDEQSNQEVRVAPQNPEIQTIVEKMDQAKINGDHVLFRTLLKEYESLNPSTKVENGPQVKIAHSRPINNPTPRWTDNDILIDSAWDYQALSMDSRSDGYIYLAAATQENSGDDYVINLYYSDVTQYGGTEWIPWLILSWGGHNLYNPSLKIVEMTDSNYLFVAFEGQQIASPFERTVLIYRHTFGSGIGTFYNISAVAGIEERGPSIDADDLQYPGDTYLYCAFESTDSIVFVRSLDLGETWTSRVQIGLAGTNYSYGDPECAYGWYTSADSFTVGVAWVIYGYGAFEGYRSIRFIKNYSYGSSVDWSNIEYFEPPSDHQDGRASLKMTHGGSPSGVISFARRDTIGPDDEDLCIYYTYDGGRDWTNDTLYVPNNGYMLNCLSVDDNLGDYHSFFKGSDNDVRYKEAPYNSLISGGWSGSIAISNGVPSGLTSPASAVYNDEPCVCWKDVSATWYKIMFDALWLQTGVKERPGEGMAAGLISLAPNPSSGITRLSYTVEKEGKVTISLYDAVGRLVDNLVNKTMQAGEYSLTLNNKTLAAGVYFIRVETPEDVATKAMTIIR